MWSGSAAIVHRRAATPINHVSRFTSRPMTHTHRKPPGPSMAAAAKAFLATLTPAQRAKTVLAFNAEERFNWHYVPKERAGLPLKEMDERQRKAALALL